MTADRALCPPVAVEARLGARARPAGGRQPSARFMFAACTLDAIDVTRATVTGHLSARVGPLRCTEVLVEVAIGLDHAAELLADLEANRDQHPDTLAPVVHALHHVAAAAEHLGKGDPVLVVASCGALTAQAYAAVGAS